MPIIKAANAILLKVSRNVAVDRTAIKIKDAIGQYHDA